MPKADRPAGEEFGQTFAVEEMNKTKHTPFSFNSSVAREIFFVLAIFFIAPFFEKRGGKNGHP